MRTPYLAAAMLLAALSCGTAFAGRSAEAGLRLIPFPKQVRLHDGRFTLANGALIRVSGGSVAAQTAKDLQAEILNTTGVNCPIALSPHGDGALWTLTIGSQGREPSLLNAPEQSEGYALSVGGSVRVGARTEAGLACGIQTLRQLVRANSQGATIPRVDVIDYPSMQYRGYQDDITRGPSPRIATLMHEASMAAFLRMNFFTYYQEHQYAFSKHPDIGPANGSLLPSELSDLVAYAEPRGVEIIGCQQSFGHLTGVLQLDAYKDLRETLFTINPTVEGTYKLLDDMYSEQIPLLKSKLFNVCCDETFDLGTGPTKPLAEQIGVGGVYVRHIRRIHDIITEKYGKRPMMWGDIILQHPEKLSEIPKDTIMLSWGYDPRPSFEADLLPFAKSGYDFFVCPGVNCWGRVVPDFNAATTNIHNYVRDGAKHGALGMLNTVWMDDAENLFDYNWHGISWGAECSWNASTTSLDDFNRRVGAVLFGEKSDHYGRAIELLAKAFTLPGYDRMRNRRFYAGDFGQLSTSIAASKSQAKALLGVVEPAITELYACRKEAKTNLEALDTMIFGAERMKLMATRALDFMDASASYRAAEKAMSERRDPLPLVQKSIDMVTKIRDQHRAMKRRYSTIFLRMNKPYSLDWMQGRYDGLIGKYDDIIARMKAAQETLRSTGALPSAHDVGMELVEAGVRSTRSLFRQFDGDAAWTEAGYSGRIPVAVNAGSSARTDLPIEVEIGAEAPKGGLKLVEVGSQTPVPCQVMQIDGKAILAFVVPGETAKGVERNFFLYYGGPAQKTADGVRCSQGPNGMVWLENSRVKLLVGPEGGHIYRWEVKALGNRDFTEPGEKDWQGFADTTNGPGRNALSTIQVIASGPALARVRCSDPFGEVKTISLWTGAPWAEVTLNSPTTWFWCYDDISLMGAESATPGTYLFPTGDTGPVRKYTNGTDCQEQRNDVRWSARYVPGGPMLALVTPEVGTNHIVGPGSGMGGVGISMGAAAAHFAIYGDRAPESPAAALNSLCDTLDFRNQPAVILGGPQSKTGTAPQR